jgi:hypothetical protein
MNGTSGAESTTPAEVLAALIHDWIKYMEMRLLSIRWEEAPQDVERIVARALDETRTVGADTRGSQQLWDAARAELLATQDPALTEVVGRVDADLAALLAIRDWDRDTLVARAAEVERLVRAPGRRLRDAYFVVADEDAE